jgi:hypothetical protein
MKYSWETYDVVIWALGKSFGLKDIKILYTQEISGDTLQYYSQNHSKISNLNLSIGNRIMLTTLVSQQTGTFSTTDLYL